MGPVRATDEEVWKLVAFVKRIGSQGLLEKATGDAEAGHVVYHKSGCANCHRIDKAGGALGPELTDIGRRRGLTFLAESLARPEADIPISYARKGGHIRQTSCKSPPQKSVRRKGLPLRCCSAEAAAVAVRHDSPRKRVGERQSPSIQELAPSNGNTESCRLRGAV